MKKRRWLVAVAIVGCILVLALVWRAQPSNLRTAAFFSRNEALLEDFVALCRAEAKQHDGEYRLYAVYTDWFSGVLTCHLDLSASDDEREFPASPELRAAWERIRRLRYFTSVSCSFDEAGALEVHFSAEGEWVPYGTPTEGHYRFAYCLSWQDADYSGRPHANYWHPLGEAREQGGWYCTSHKHYDG